MVVPVRTLTVVSGILGRAHTLGKNMKALMELSTRPAVRVGLIVATVIFNIGFFLPKVPGAELSAGIPQADKIVHVLIFAFTTGVVLLLSKPRGWLMTATIVGMFVWGITVETIQDVIPGRLGDPWDVAADCLGIALAGLVGWWISRRLVREAQSSTTSLPPEGDTLLES